MKNIFRECKLNTNNEHQQQNEYKQCGMSGASEMADKMSRRCLSHTSQVTLFIYNVFGCVSVYVVVPQIKKRREESKTLN